jgi:chromosome segregation ATPase
MSDFLVNQVLERLSALSEQFSKLDAKVEATVEALSDKIESARTDLTAKFDGVRNDVADLRNDLVTTRSELMARMDRLQDTMMHLREEVFFNFAQAERIGKRSIGASDETRALATQVNAMQRVMLNLSGRVDEVYLKR